MYCRGSGCYGYLYVVMIWLNVVSAVGVWCSVVGCGVLCCVVGGIG